MPNGSPGFFFLKKTFRMNEQPVSQIPFKGDWGRLPQQANLRRLHRRGNRENEWTCTGLHCLPICETPYFLSYLSSFLVHAEYSRLRKPWFRNFGNRHSGGWKLFDWLVYHLSGSAVLSSPEPLCGAVAGFTMPQYLIGFHQSINDSAVSFWPDTTDTNAGIFTCVEIP